MEIGIIGAGVAGIGAAYELRESAAEVTILEKSRGVGGRAATRRKNDCIYDHGANYINVESEDDLATYIEELGTEDLIDIEEPVWTFDSEENIEEGENRDSHAFTYTEGITEFAKRVFSRTDARLETETRIEAIARENERWRVESEDSRYKFDALVMTPPAPQTATLLSDAEWDDPLKDDLKNEIEAVPYRTILSAILHYPFEIDRPYYALVNIDKDHEIGWLSREECKAGHVADGESLLVAQMAPDWSLERYGESEKAITEAAAELVSELLDESRLETPDWTDIQRWRHALPDDGADSTIIERGEDNSLFFAGDWVVGEGRVAAAFENGRTVGERLL